MNMTTEDIRNDPSDWSFLWQHLTFTIFNTTIIHFEIRKIDWVIDKRTENEESRYKLLAFILFLTITISMLFNAYI